MIKLTDAKCPSCGAAIQVNKDLEKSICQYCGSTILIEEAIQKIEISGKVQVDGIETRDEKLEKAIKHLKLNEFSKSDKILEELFAKDEFDIEVCAYLIKNKIKYLQSINFKMYSCSETCFKTQWDIAKSILDKVERLEKIDDDKKSDKILEECKDYINNLKDAYPDRNIRYTVSNKLNQAQEILSRSIKKYMARPDQSSILLERKRVLQSVLVECFGRYAEQFIYYNEGRTFYYFFNLEELYKDGGAYIEFFYKADYEHTRKKKFLITPTMDEVCESEDDLLKKCMKFEKMINEKMTPGIIKLFKKFGKK